MPEIKYIRLDQIRQNPVSLRDVARAEEPFLDLVNSIKREGVLSSISVRAKTSADDDKLYEIVDGLQRFSGSCEAGTGVVDFIADPKDETRKISSGKYLEVDGDTPGTKKHVGIIPAQVIDRDEADVLLSQMIGNVHKIETKPVQYAAQVKRYLGYNAALTINELAIKMGKSPVYLNKMLDLLKLEPTIKPFVDDGSISLVNALPLSKLPLAEQPAWLERAKHQKGDEFGGHITKRLKEIRDANKRGENAGPEQFTPMRHFRKKPEVEAEAVTPSVIPALIRELNLTEGLKHNAQGLIEAACRGAVLGLEWMMNFDPKSQQAAREKDASKREQDKIAKIRRDAEKTQKREEELRQKTAEASLAAAKAREAAAALPPEPALVPA